jgi:WD40 repeat protein
MEAVGCWWYIFGDVGLIMSPNYRRQRRFTDSRKQSAWHGHSLHTPILLGLSLANRNFIIGTFDATVYHMTVDGTKLEKLFVEPRDAVYAVSCHPYQPLIAVGSVCGMIKVWDFEKKVYLFSRTFEKGLGVQCLTYNPEGTWTLSRFHDTQRDCPRLTHIAEPWCPSQAASLPSFPVEGLPSAHCSRLTFRKKGVPFPLPFSDLSFQEPCLELDSPRGQFIFLMRCL